MLALLLAVFASLTLRSDTLAQEAGALGTIWLEDGLPMEFRWCPPGSFVMGSPPDEAYTRGDDEQQVDVTLSQGFWLGASEVTQAQFEFVMDSNPSSHLDGRYPVDRITRSKALEFCQVLNTEYLEMLAGWTVRLPTEAEWEYACRAGTQTAHSFGNQDKDTYAHTDSVHYIGKIAYAGSKEPNPWGLYDMHGNLFEWCLDGYQNRLPGGTDPIGQSPNLAVLRSGVYQDVLDVRSANRTAANPLEVTDAVGFRVVLYRAAEENAGTGDGGGEPPTQEKPRSIALTIVDRNTGQPLDGVSVEVPGTQRVAAPAEAPAGTYYFEAWNREQEEFTFYADRQGYEGYGGTAERIVNQGYYQLYASISLKPRPAPPRTLVLNISDRLTGRPLNGADVDISNAVQVAQPPSAKPGTYHFEIRSPEAREFKIYANAEGYYNHSGPPSKINLSGTPVQAWIDMVPMPRTVEIRLIDKSTGAPIVGARLTLSQANLDRIGENPGTYWFKASPEYDRFDLAASKEGYLELNRMVQPEMGPLGIPTATVAMTPAFREFSITIVDQATRRPLPSATIEVSPALEKRGSKTNEGRHDYLAPPDLANCQVTVRSKGYKSIYNYPLKTDGSGVIAMKALLSCSITVIDKQTRTAIRNAMVVSSGTQGKVRTDNARGLHSYYVEANTNCVFDITAKGYKSQKYGVRIEQPNSSYTVEMDSLATPTKPPSNPTPPPPTNPPTTNAPKKPDDPGDKVSPPNDIPPKEDPRPPENTPPVDGTRTPKAPTPDPGADLDPPEDDDPNGTRAELMIRVHDATSNPVENLFMILPSSGRPLGAKAGAYRMGLPQGRYEAEATTKEGIALIGVIDVPAQGRAILHLKPVVEDKVDEGEELFRRLDTDGNQVIDERDCEEATWSVLAEFAGADNQLSRPEITRMIQAQSDSQRAEESRQRIPDPEAERPMWERLDSNQDGRVDQQDTPEIWEALRRYDRNADGTIDRQELKTASDRDGSEIDPTRATGATRVLSLDDQVKELERRLDLDENGVVEQKDFGSDNWAALADADSDGDAQLSPAELRKMLGANASDEAPAKPSAQNGGILTIRAIPSRSEGGR